MPRFPPFFNRYRWPQCWVVSRPQIPISYFTDPSRLSTRPGCKKRSHASSSLFRATYPQRINYHVSRIEGSISNRSWWVVVKAFSNSVRSYFFCHGAFCSSTVANPPLKMANENRLCFSSIAYLTLLTRPYQSGYCSFQVKFHPVPVSIDSFSRCVPLWVRIDRE